MPIKKKIIRRTKAENLQRKQRAESQTEIELPKKQDPTPTQRRPKPAPKPKRTTPRLHPQALIDEIEALGPQGMAALMGMDPPKRIKAGDQVQGRITRIGAETIFINLGTKSEGVLIPPKDHSYRVGEEIQAFVLHADGRGIQLTTTLNEEASPQMLRDALAQEVPVEGVVTGHNKGGYEVKVCGQRAFCPFSHFSLQPSPDSDQEIGKTLTFMISQLEGRDILLSRRAILEKERLLIQNARVSELREGQRLQGTVTSIKDFGAFVDLQGVEGLLPQRFFSTNHIPSSGEKLKVVIKKITENKITLQLSDTPEPPPSDDDDRTTLGHFLKGLSFD